MFAVDKYVVLLYNLTVVIQMSNTPHFLLKSLDHLVFNYIYNSVHI